MSFSPALLELGPARFTAVLSEHDRDLLGNDGEVVVPVQEAFVHPEYEEYHNDLGEDKRPILGWTCRTLAKLERTTRSRKVSIAELKF